MLTERIDPASGIVTQLYSRKPEIAMMDVHGALGSLLYACQEELRDLGGYCELRYRQGTYLTLEVECSTKKSSEAIVARLNHGVLWGEYDYRFKTICEPLGYQDGERRIITASVNLCHDCRELYAESRG